MHSIHGSEYKHGSKALSLLSTVALLLMLGNTIVKNRHKSLTLQQRQADEHKAFMICGTAVALAAAVLSLILWPRSGSPRSLWCLE